MTKNELLKFKKQIDLVLKKLQEEALEEGVIISSAEFQEVLLLAKKRLLEERGITIEEYNQMMSEINEDRKANKKAKEEKTSELISKVSMLKGDKGEDGKDGGKGDKGEQGIQGIQGIRGIQGIKGSKGDKGDRGVRGYKGDKGDDAKVEEVIKDIQYLQESHTELYDKLGKLPTKDWAEKVKDIEWRIENINTKRASISNRSDAGSFNTAISDSRYYKKAEVDAKIVAGGGDVTKVGTPVNNQVGVWTGDGTLEGDAALTYDATTDTLTSVTFAGALTGNADTATTAGNLSGTPALPNGTTATTQAAADNSTKLATTAYADAISTTPSEISVNQVTHGFLVGDIIRSDGTANSFTKAKADSASNAEISGIVTTVTDVNNFKYSISGYITTGVPTATAGTVYFLSPSTAGALTSTETTTVGQISKPLLIVLESAAKAIFYNWRGMEITATGDVGAPTGASYLTATTEANLSAEINLGALATGLLKGTVAGGVSTISAVTDNSANWNTAYTDRLKWDGGATDLVAATGRTSLGLVIGTNVQAWDADLDTWATKTAPSGIVIGTTDTQTLTNKRITYRTGTTTSHATPTINTDNVDFYSLTAQAEAITSFTTNLSGTPTERQTLWIAITGTAARAITWGTSFEASTVALPTTTVTTARLDVGFVWNTVTSKWRCVASA